MRMTRRKKEILSYYEPEQLDWITGEIGAPPFDVSGIAYLLHGTGINDNRHQLESTRRTLDAMVRDGLLEKYRSREARSIAMGGETTATVIRYGLPGTVTVVRDSEGTDGAIEGVCERLD